jgi:hypothetical protein
MQQEIQYVHYASLRVQLALISIRIVMELVTRCARTAPLHGVHLEAIKSWSVTLWLINSVYRALHVKKGFTRHGTVVLPQTLSARRVRIVPTGLVCHVPVG